MLEALSSRQRDVYEVIVTRIKSGGGVPTIREIGDELGMSSTNAVNVHLVALERKGWITTGDGQARAIRPVIVGACPECGAPMFADVPEAADEASS